MPAPTLLYILHCFYNRAGVEVHVRDLRRALAKDFATYTLFPHEGEVYLLAPDESVRRYPGSPPLWPTTPETIPAVNASIDKILDQVAPDIIHVQHTHNLPLSVLAQVTARKAPTLMSHHDYYLITPYYTMQGTSDPLDCFSREYSERTFRADISPYLARRREYMQRELPKFTVHIAPSRYMAAVLARVYSLNCRVIEHGIEPFARLPKTPGTALRFGCVGSLLPQKGWDLLARAFAEMRIPPEHATLHFYGGVRRTDIPGVFFHGVYEHEDLARICSEIDAAFIPSVFAETFSLLLSEMWMGGVPTAVADIGAMGERIVEGVNGTRFKSGDIADMQRALRWFMDNDTWRSWQLPTPRVLDDMAAEYKEMYHALLR